MVDPQQFFKFGGNNFDLLCDIYSRKSVTDSDLRDLIKRHRLTTSPSVSHTIAQLSDLGFLETSPGATASKELTAPVVKILGYLLRSQRRTPFIVLKGYIDALEAFSTDLDAAINEGSGNNATRILGDCNEIIEDIRRYSYENKDSILGECLAVKSNSIKQSVSKRYDTVNRIREKYLNPMREMVDISRPIQRFLDQLGKLFVDGTQKFKKKRIFSLSDEFTKSRARLLRLRSAVRKDFNECCAEVDPLYKVLHKENKIVRGASRALEILDRQGFSALVIGPYFHITRIKVEGLFSDNLLEGFFHTLTDYQPVAPKIMAESLDDSIATSYINPVVLKKMIANSIPIPDFLEWLFKCYPQEKITTILQAYVWVKTNTNHTVIYGPTRKLIRIHHYKIKYHPFTLGDQP